MQDIRPRRSALYMPASNARALEKARGLPADAIILDLEDAVAPDKKDLARDQAVAAIKAGGFGKREIVLRVNGPDTPWCKDDLAAAAAAGPHAVLLPKPDDAQAIASFTSAMTAAGVPGGTRLWAMIETAKAILNIREIAASAGAPGSRLTVLAMGTNDLAKETGARLTGNREAGLYWFSSTITAARAYGLAALDSAYNDFRDGEGFKRECSQGRDLGFDGKTLIHPDQIAAANEAYAPPDAEVAWARRILAAFDEPANKGKGVINLDGRMVELLHAEMARKTVAIAERIAALSQSIQGISGSHT